MLDCNVSDLGREVRAMFSVPRQGTCNNKFAQQADAAQVRSMIPAAPSIKVVGRREVVGGGKILVGRRRGVMVGREKNDFFYEPHSSKILNKS